MAFSGQPATQRQINPHAGIIFRAPPAPNSGSMSFGENFAAGAPLPEMAAPAFPSKTLSSSHYAPVVAAPVPSFGGGLVGGVPGGSSSLSAAPVSATMQQLLMRNWLVKLSEVEFRALLLSLGNVFPSLVTAIEQEVKRHQNQLQSSLQQQPVTGSGPATVPFVSTPSGPATVPFVSTPSGLQLNVDAKPFRPSFAQQASASALY